MKSICIHIHHRICSGVLSMRVGERSDFTISPSYAYGKVGAPPSVPGNATLTYQIELLSVQEKETSDSSGYDSHDSDYDDQAFVKTIVTKGSGLDHARAFFV
jgi:hypothetical protein